MIPRLRDDALKVAAENVPSKLTVTMPETVREALAAPPIRVSEGAAMRPAAADPAAVRSAIRAHRKLRIAYQDEAGRRTRRTIWPLAMVYYVDVTLVAAWCELRGGLRHFRIERFRSCTVLDDRFPEDTADLLTQALTSREDGSPH